MACNSSAIATALDVVCANVEAAIPTQAPNAAWRCGLKTKPAYVIEVLSEKFDHLGQKEKDEILLHEIAHIPKNFSGSLLPHIRKKGKRNFHDRVHELVSKHTKGRGFFRKLI